MTPRKWKTDAPEREERVLFPVAIAICLTLALALAGVSYSRDRANQDEVVAEIAAVQAAVDEVRGSVGRTAHAYAENLSPGTLARRAAVSGPLRTPGPLDADFVVDLASDFDAAPAASAGDFAPLFRSLAPVAAELRERDGLRGGLSGVAESDPWGRERVEVARSGAKAYFAALVPRLTSVDGASDFALLSLRAIDDRMLADIARRARTERIDVVSAQEADATGLIKLASYGAPDMALVWRAHRPGDEIVDQNALFLLAFAAAFAALIVFHSRRVTQEAVVSEEQAKAYAGQDMLTGLPNRFLFVRLLENEIERVKRSVNERGAALMFLDIDRFKEINDSYGHEAGDRLVVGLTQRIVAILRSTGRLARIGGDEFAIIQTDIVGPRDTEILARRIVTALAEPIDLGDQKVYASLSIGIAVCPHDADSAEELMRRADLALYRAKNEGRNRFCYFEQKMGDQLTMRKTVEDDLRSAIESGGLVVQYQPVMEITGKRMVGVEALVRWQHPVHGFISPANFITLAEQCGLILPLGEWVLRRALTDIKDWPELRLAVNVSGIQFRQKDFVSMLGRILTECSVEPGQLELELTESVLLADADNAEDSMVDLRAMGVRLALDDFGTGYSSLIYLRRFAFDKIKIDKSFLDSMEATGESAIIIHSIVHLGRALGLTVTAEGVETPDQHRFLQALGCHELQGYLFSRPVGADEITQRLMRQRETDRPAAPKAVA